MKTRFFFVFAFALFLLSSLNVDAQITINIRYTAENGNVRKYVEEMESSGIAARIRAVEGCLGYEYFYPADDPNGLLLIDSWENQDAIDVHHASPMMAAIAALREKYDLHMTVERFVSMEENEEDRRFIRE